MQTDTHLELLKSETHVSRGDRAWSRWIDTAEQLVGHALDGDQKRDGYSLDYAYDAWRRGETAEFHAEQVKAAVWALAAPKSA